jgi:hypothetical protein
MAKSTGTQKIHTMTRTPDKWIADGYDVKQRGGRAIAYCGPHHTPEHEYPLSCKLQDEENARWIAAAPARIAELESQVAALLEAVQYTVSVDKILRPGERHVRLEELLALAKLPAK